MMKGDELENMSKKDLLGLAKRHDVAGRSKMTKDELVHALSAVGTSEKAAS